MNAPCASRSWFGLAILLLFLSFGPAGQAQDAATPPPPATDLPEVGYVEGRILELTPASRGTPIGAGGIALVHLIDGSLVNAVVPSTDDLGATTVDAYRVGDRVELYFAPTPGGTVREYVVVDWIRRPALYLLVGLFLLVSVAVARLKGLRAFIATGVSLAIIVSFIVPRILDGWNPMLVTLLGVGGILVLAIYFVHGLNWSTTAALVGTMAAVLATMALGVLFTHLAHLTGFGSEEAMLITFSAEQVDLRGLLLAGLLVGALGALTDITIVQASVVRELAHVNPSFAWSELYRRGMNVGLDHIGSLVNTLVLAYVGAGLPLLVLLSVGDYSWGRALNIEQVAAEVVHTLVGSIGLILGVPITTALAAVMFRGGRLWLREGELDQAHHHH
ncbi:MAG: YibE/F family protein [Trueperaceae bacterium]